MWGWSPDCVEPHRAPHTGLLCLKAYHVYITLYCTTGLIYATGGRRVGQCDVSNIYWGGWNENYTFSFLILKFQVIFFFVVAGAHFFLSLRSFYICPCPSSLLGRAWAYVLCTKLPYSCWS